jgi:Zn-dependent protease with chaperone function
LNAYTFGFGSTKVVVVYSALFKNMDEGEISFILGHEMGHVSLGHTRINSFIGGMAGIPAPWGISVILRGIFLSWNRACEYSADRAGLLACGNVNKAISALIKLGAGPGAHSQAELDRALKMLDEEDDNIFSLLGESLQTHPMLIKRIQQLLRYASSRNYEKLQVWVRQNPNIKKE